MPGLASLLALFNASHIQRINPGMYGAASRLRVGRHLPAMVSETGVTHPPLSFTHSRQVCSRNLITHDAHQINQNLHAVLRPEEGLLFGADGVYAAWASETHLRRAGTLRPRYVLLLSASARRLEVSSSNVGKCAKEDGLVVEGFGATKLEAVLRSER